MSEGNKRTMRLLYRLTLAVLACMGLYTTIFGASGSFMGAASLCYYTIQSNLWALALALAAVVMSLCGAREPNWFRLLRFVIAVAVMVTFLVFWAMLAPTMPPRYLISVSNLTLHTLVPLLTLGDALFLDEGYLPRRRQLLFCTLPPLWYLGFAMARAELSAKPLSGGSRYPYWFLDVDKLGWFGFRNGVGVFYWVMVVVVIVLGLGILLYRLKRRRGAKEVKKQ